jgi:acyl-CoA thioester hydrolase
MLTSQCDNVPMSRISHPARIRVRYAETDQMGVAYYANYLVWMEVGRVDYCKALGFRYRDMEVEDGVLLAVVEAYCRYLSPARYDEEVIVETWVEQATSRLVRFGYRMCEAASGRELASGETKHIFCNPQMRPTKLPPKYRHFFGLT